MVSLVPYNKQKQNSWMIKNITLFLLSTLLISCATSQEVVFSQRSSQFKANSAYLTIHGGRSSDMDLHLQNALVKRGLNVKTGAELMTYPDADILIKYSDSWRWDIVMYLEMLNLNIFDSKTGDLLATGSWKNSAFHRFRGADVVVNDLLSEIFAKIQTPIQPANQNIKK